MADNSTLIKVALFGGAGYLAYQMGWLSSLGLSPSAAPATPAPAAGSTPALPSPATPAPPAASTPPPAAVAAPVLDTIFSNIQLAARRDGVSVGAASALTPDDWGWYLNNELTRLGLGAAPDPVPLFGTRPFAPISVAAWWGPMSAALKSQMGLSGLGIYGGLSALAGRRHR